MINFLKSLISSNKGSYSSKRFSGLLTLCVILICAIVATIKSNGIMPQTMFDSLLLFICACLGLTSAEAILSKNKDDKKDIKEETDIKE